MTTTPTTQRKWTVTYQDGWTVLDEDGQVICQTNLADARLIAQAPDMLALLDDCEAMLYRLNGSDDLPGYAAGLAVEIRTLLRAIEEG